MEWFYLLFCEHLAASLLHLGKQEKENARFLGMLDDKSKQCAYLAIFVDDKLMQSKVSGIPEYTILMEIWKSWDNQRKTKGRPFPFQQRFT
jgi:hypothetical protein